MEARTFWFAVAGWKAKTNSCALPSITPLNSSMLGRSAPRICLGRRPRCVRWTVVCCRRTAAAAELWISQHLPGSVAGVAVLAVLAVAGLVCFRRRSLAMLKHSVIFAFDLSDVRLSNMIVELLRR